MSTGAITDLERAIDALANQAVDAVAQGDDLLALERLQRRLGAQISRRIAAFDAAGEHQLRHAASTAAWLARETRVGKDEAGPRVSAARTLRTMDTTRAAWEAGEIDQHKARVIASVKQNAQADDEFAEYEAHLVNVARGHTARRVHAIGRKWTEALDDHRGRARRRRAHERRHAARRCTWSRSTGGVGYLNGSFTTDRAEHIEKAIDRMLRRLRVEGDERTMPQLRADAVAAIFEAWLGGQPGRGNLPHILIVSDETTAAGFGFGRSEYASGVGADPETLQRLMCFGNVQRLVVDDHGVPLSLGRTRRLFSPHQFRAMTARDGGCRGPQCSSPASDCQPHHVGHWSDGGPTNLDSGLLLCTIGGCHELVHEGQWTIEGDANGRVTFFDAHGHEIGTSEPRAPDPVHLTVDGELFQRTRERVAALAGAP